jgi:Uma2 family endonuclease
MCPLMNKPASAFIGDTAARFTTAEFLHMAEVGAFDDMRVELIDGEIHRMPPPNSDHGDLQASLLALLWPVARAHGLRATGEVGIDLGDGTVLAPDATLRRPTDGGRLLRPEELLLVVEAALSTVGRDTGMKRTRYASAGIPTYWVVDGARGVTHVFTDPADGDYRSHLEVPFAQPLALPGSDATITLG